MSTRSTCARLVPKPTDGQQAAAAQPGREPPRPQCILLRDFQIRQTAERIANAMHQST